MRGSFLMLKLVGRPLFFLLWMVSSSAMAGLLGDAYWPSSNAAQEVKIEAKNLPTLDSIQSANLQDRMTSEVAAVPTIRGEGIQSAAAMYGAQAGLASALSQINESLAKNSSEYNRIYNFGAVMLEPGFLPPVISEGREPYNQSSDGVVRAADLIYKIEFDARIVNTPPRWQNYLAFQVVLPELPDHSLLPKTDAENDIWDEWASKGWAEGEKQAKTIFSSNLARLNRDYLGMWRFKRLYSQGMVSKPILARSNLGVTGGGREMAVNDRLVKITESSKLNPNETHWLYQAPK